MSQDVRSYQKRQWHPTPVLLPRKSHGWRSLVGCSLWNVKSRTRLNDFTFTFHFHALEKEMATHSSVLAWRIPGTAGPGGLLSLGLHRVGHDWSDLAAAAATHLTWTSSYSSVPCWILPLWYLPNRFICLCVPQHLLIPIYVQGTVVDFRDLTCQHQYATFC